MTEPELPKPEVPARSSPYLPEPPAARPARRRRGLARRTVTLTAAVALGVALGWAVPHLRGTAPLDTAEAIAPGAAAASAPATPVVPLPAAAPDAAARALDDLVAERDRLRRELAAWTARTRAAEARHRAAVAEAERRSDEVERLAAELRALRATSAHAEEAFRTFVESHATALEEVLGGTGIAVEPLLERVGETIQGGQGGPLHPLDDVPGGITTFPAPSTVPEPADATRLQRLELLLAAAPLLAPLKGEFRMTSGFGTRQDPITRRKALHTGLDFVAPRGSWIVATSAGTVVRAGRMGAYGLTVEIDHGFGISTLYAHLRSVTVKPGETVRPSDVVGVIGSTGRSTGLHLHYEVRLDGQPLDPRRFLAARARLAEVLGSGDDPPASRRPVVPALRPT